MKTRKVIVLLLVFSLFTLGIAACSSKEVDTASSSPNPEENNKPVTLKVFQYGAGITDDEFKEMMADPVKKKFPNISMELVRSVDKNTASQLIADGTFPDLIFASTLDSFYYLDMDVPLDLNDLVKKNKFNLNLYEKRVIDTIKSYSDKDQLYGLPFSLNYGMLFYNKSLFDKAGVAYPKDGMNWGEVIDLAKKLSQKIPSGTYAFAPAAVGRTSVSFLLPFVDRATGKALLDSDEWRSYFQLFKSIKDIPGNGDVTNEAKAFVSDQNLAMLAAYSGRVGELEQLYNKGQPFDWDFVSYPKRQDSKAEGMETEVIELMISKTSKNIDDAFKVAAYLGSDPDVQTILSKNGRLPALNDSKIRDVFGTNLKSLQGKNIQGIFKNTYGSIPKPTRYDDVVKSTVGPAMNNVLSGTVDINTALRQAEEQSNQLISELKAQGK